MIKKLHLKNFKSFLNQDIVFAPLTVLTGTNASGKSTIIQAIRMIKKSYIDEKSSPLLNTFDVPKNLKSKLSKDNYFIISFSTGLEQYSTGIHSIESDSYIINELEKNNDIEKIQNIHYVSADRFGPKNQLPIGNTNEIKNVGAYGEYVISFIDKFKYTEVSNFLKLNEEDKNLLSNINSWLSVISKDTKLTYKMETSQNIYYPFYNDIVPSETAYGLSFSLPIITELLYCGEEQILLIENPEAHLHPYAQSKLGELIARAVKTGKQVIVETHSDHIIDGIRIAVKRGIIKYNQVIFHYLSRDDFNEPTRIETPQIDAVAKLSFWPKGFFDQSLIDKAILARKINE